MQEPDIRSLMCDLQNRDPRRREGAAIELGKLKLIRTAKSLVRHFQDSDAAVRDAVRWALVQIGSGAVDRIAASLEALDNDGKALAFQTLGEIADAGGVDPMLAFLQKVNAGVAQTYRLQKATDGALNALAQILTASGAQCSRDDLLAVAAFREISIMTMISDDVQTSHAKKIGDCAVIISLAEAELLRRGDWQQT